MSSVAVNLANALAQRDAEIRLLRSQLTARDAALDAVLQLANKWLAVDSQQTVNAYLSHDKGAALRELLLKHGIHPK